MNNLTFQIPFVRNSYNAVTLTTYLTDTALATSDIAIFSRSIAPSQVAAGTERLPICELGL